MSDSPLGQLLGSALAGLLTATALVFSGTTPEVPQPREQGQPRKKA